MRNRLLALALSVLLLVPVTPSAHAAPPDAYPCLHPDLTVSANDKILSTGTEVALDGGMAHAGTGLTLTFQARTFNLTIDLCNLRLTDTRTWQVDHWPCENTPKPKPARTQSLTWSVAVPLDCKFVGSPNLLSVSLTNGKPVTSNTAGATTTYIHSGDGRRAGATTGRQTTRYLWDPLSPQILSTTADTEPTRYLYGSSLLAQQTPAARTPFITTPNGSILTTTTTTAKPAQHEYEPYGQTRAGPPASPTPGYIGGLQLPNGNYLLGQREYNPATGTFLTTDQAGSANPYAYTTGNPLKTTDLQGLDDTEDTLTDVSHISGYVSTGALVGAIVCTVARPCAPAVPILLEISSATGAISAGAAGILDSQACILKGNCSQLAADVAVGLVASRFSALGSASETAIAGAVGRRAATTGGGAVAKYDANVALGYLTMNGTAKASDLVAFGEAQGWVLTQSKSGPLIFIDAAGVKRMTLKRGSPRTPGSELPHVEVRDAGGRRVDPFANQVTRKSPSNHVPIEWDLP